MNSSLGLFSNLTRQVQYRHVDTNREIPFVLTPVLGLFMHQLKRHILYAEGCLLKYLQQNKQSYNNEDIHDFTRHMHTPLLYIYVFIAAILFSIIGIVYICCMGACKSKCIDPTKHQCWFCTDLLFYGLFLLCLVFGWIGLVQISIEIQEGLTILPTNAKNLILDYRDNVNLFKSQIEELDGTVKNVTGYINSSMSSLPANVIQVVRHVLNPDLERALNNFRIFREELEALRKKFGIDKEVTVLPDPLRACAQELEKNIVMVYSHVSVLRKLVNENRNFDFQQKMLMTTELDIVKSDLVFKINSEFPDLNMIHNNLMLINSYFLPKLNDSLRFLESFENNFDNETQMDRKSVYEIVNQVQNFSQQVKVNISDAITLFFPEYIQQEMMQTANRTNEVIVNTFIYKGKSNFDMNSSTTWILLLPSFYILVSLVFFIAGGAYSLVEFKKISEIPSWDAAPVRPFCPIMLFKAAMYVSISILWMLFLFATIFYVAHLPLTVLCQLVSDEKIFDEYIDKPVWYNKTWADFVLDPYLPKHNATLKLREIFQKCSNNETIYKSLQMDEYWNLKDKEIFQNLTINNTILNRHARNSLKRMTIPDTSFMYQFLLVMKSTVKSFHDESLQEIETKVDKFQSSNISENLLYMMGILPRDERFDDLHKRLRAVLVSLDHIQSKLTFRVLGNLSELVYFKGKVDKLHGKLNSIYKDQNGFMKRINGELSSKVSKYIRAFIANTTRLKNDTEEYLLKSVEHDIGRCDILTRIYETSSWTICYYGLMLVSSAWVALALISFSMGCLIILSCRMCGYLRGSHKHYLLLREQLSLLRYQQRARVRSHSEHLPINRSIQYDEPQVKISHSR